MKTWLVHWPLVSLLVQTSSLDMTLMRKRTTVEPQSTTPHDEASARAWARRAPTPWPETTVRKPKEGPAATTAGRAAGQTGTAHTSAGAGPRRAPAAAGLPARYGLGWGGGSRRPRFASTGPGPAKRLEWVQVLEQGRWAQAAGQRQSIVF